MLRCFEDASMLYADSQTLNGFDALQNLALLSVSGGWSKCIGKEVWPEATTKLFSQQDSTKFNKIPQDSTNTRKPTGVCGNLQPFL